MIFSGSQAPARRNLKKKKWGLLIVNLLLTNINENLQIILMVKNIFLTNNK